MTNEKHNEFQQMCILYLICVMFHLPPSFIFFFCFLMAILCSFFFSPTKKKVCISKFWHGKCVNILDKCVISTCRFGILFFLQWWYFFIFFLDGGLHAFFDGDILPL